jgi:hypothetical protein
MTIPIYPSSHLIGNMSTTLHNCDECETSFESKEELDQHNREEHPER